jgi:hypothetical protein
MAVVRQTFFRSLIIVGFGVLFVVVGFVVHRQQSAYPGGTSATATVSSIDMAEDKDGNPSYTAVYAFTAADGREVSFRDLVSSGDRPEIGSTVQISYRPGNPAGARVVRGWDFISIVAVAAGGLVGLLGLRGVVVHLLRLGFLLSAGRPPRAG